jgi:hypothetical protein
MDWTSTDAHNEEAEAGQLPKSQSVQEVKLEEAQKADAHLFFGVAHVKRFITSSKQGAIQSG